MSASLVGSEMCIRDRRGCARVHDARPCMSARMLMGSTPTSSLRSARCWACLLYTSDAADDM
eukprot:2703054-Alexandrium_andersonii.AAC.1